MKTFLLTLLIASVACAQAWNIGGPATNDAPLFAGDICTGGSSVIPPSNVQIVATYPGEFKTFRWGPGISCTFPLPGLLGILTFETIEPTVNGPGQRVFTLTINGIVQQPIDIYKSCGANTPCPFTYPVYGNNVVVTCQAQVRNCLLSAAVLTPFLPSAMPIPAYHSSLQGVQDGVNTTFTLFHTPNDPQSLFLFKNGLLQRAIIDFTLVGPTINFLTPPAIGDILEGSYVY